MAAEASVMCETKVAPRNPYGISQEELATFNVDQMRDQNKEKLEAYGGVKAVAEALQVNLHDGLDATENDIKMRQGVFGPNYYPEPPMSGWWALFFESFKDLTLIILCIAAVVSFVVGISQEPDHGWIDGVAILIAVLIVAVVTATNDYQKERQFRALSAVSDNVEVKVVRKGAKTTINVHDLVVGDVVVLEGGDKIPADGIYIDGDACEANESSLTGEPDDLKKNTQRDPFLLSGCVVTHGGCRMLAVAVGAESRWGRIKSRLATEAENTPLQDKLDTMAQHIGIVGGVAALLTLIALLIQFFIRDDDEDVAKFVIDAFIIAVTIVVVAVPEGLPLAVTISLAFSTKKMLADQNLIRVLAACETMGNATNICSDKTGTLTENRMTVVEAWMQGTHYKMGNLPTSADLPDDIVTLLRDGLSINSTAFLVDGQQGRVEVKGSKTEGALIMFAQRLGADYTERRELMQVTKQYPFSSAKKMMSTLVRIDGGFRVYVKGASEYVLGRSSALQDNGGVRRMDSETNEVIQGVILGMAKGALRTIGVAHKDFTEETLPADWSINPPDENDLVFDCLCGIQDPLRPDVIDAVRTCQRAGIMVRMVTGDNLETAKAIARQCGILTEGGEAMEGPTFRDLTPEQLDRILPRLQVLARSSPDDKHTLVVRLNGVKLPDGQMEWHEDHPNKDWNQLKDRILPGYREEWEIARGGAGNAHGEVVGVTGDGTNDAPALKAADVGLAMGTGTDVAKSASDIVILDDRFSSIKQAVLWGRSVYDNIRKFLQFQLTVNVVALFITFLAAVLGFDPPLNAVMMLWVNLIMDTMGALALGTEAPTLDLLERRPYKRSAHLVSLPMWRNILVQSAFQLVLLMVMLLSGAADQTITPVRNGSNQVVGCVISHDEGGIWGDLGVVDGREACFSAVPNDDKTDCVCDTGENDYTHYTFMFNAFVWCQLFNEFNARRINSDWNVFRGLFTNWLFMAVIVTTIGLQFFIVEVGGEFTKTTGLSWELWLWSIVLGFVALPLGVLMRFIPVEESASSFAGYVDGGKIEQSAIVSMSGGAKKGQIMVASNDVKPSPPVAGSGST